MYKKPTLRTFDYARRQQLARSIEFSTINPPGREPPRISSLSRHSPTSVAHEYGPKTARCLSGFLFFVIVGHAYSALSYYCSLSPGHFRARKSRVSHKIPLSDVRRFRTPRPPYYYVDRETHKTYERTWTRTRVIKIIFPVRNVLRAVVKGTATVSGRVDGLTIIYRGQ